MTDRFLKRRFFLFCLGAVLLCGFNRSVVISEPVLVTVQQASKLIEQEENLQIVDIRTPWEYNKGHLANARLINWYGFDFARQIETLDKTRPILVYCHSGVRSQKSMQVFVDAGFQKIYHMTAGYKGWHEAGLPTVL